MENVKGSGKTLLWIVGGLLFLACYVSFCRSSGSGKEPKERRRRDVAATSASSQKPRNEARPAASGKIQDFKTEHRKVLEAVAKGDEEGEELLLFLEGHASFGVFLTGGFIAFDGPQDKNDGQAIQVLSSSLTERRQNGLLTHSPWEYDRHSSLLHTPSLADYHPMFAGAFLAHELKHAYDAKHGALPQDPSDRIWAQSEVAAYRLELRLLDRAVKGEFWRTIDVMLADAGLPEKHNGCLTLVSFRNREGERFKNSFSGIFPQAKSFEEERMRLGLLPIALNFRNAEKTGAGEDGAVACILADRPKGEF